MECVAIATYLCRRLCRRLGRIPPCLSAPRICRNPSCHRRDLRDLRSRGRGPLSGETAPLSWARCASRRPYDPRHRHRRTACVQNKIVTIEICRMSLGREGNVNCGFLRSHQCSPSSASETAAVSVLAGVSGEVDPDLAPTQRVLVHLQGLHQ